MSKRRGAQSAQSVLDELNDLLLEGGPRCAHTSPAVIGLDARRTESSKKNRKSKKYAGAEKKDSPHDLACKEYTCQPESGFFGWEVPNQ